MEKTIEEGNILIDVFMGEDGLLGKEYTEHYSDEFYQPTTREYEVEDLEYHSSWDWLMPVVEKIADMDNQGLFSSEDGYDEIILIHCTSILCHKRAVYDRVIQFIQWYNNQKQNNQ